MTVAGRTLVASAPTRLDFGGGWTDVPPYPEERGGFVSNLAISRRATVRVSDSTSPHHSPPLAKAAVAHFAAENAGQLSLNVGQLGVSIESDFPVGAGLGGSSAAGVALAAALHAVRGDLPPAASLAEWSREVEVVEMGIAGGRQDHYAAAFGGALGLSFTATTQVDRALLSEDTCWSLERRCLLAYTGESRISGTTITAVLDAYKDRVPRVVDALDRMAQLARLMHAALQAGDVDALAALVDEHWVHQRALHPAITTARIDALEAAARGAGATGLKALGASGGGCVIVFARDDDVEAVSNAIAPYAELLSWRVDEHGVMIEG
jgi:D-glycero-alpha-D-manno-heptose-7-phosphate kinase